MALFIVSGHRLRTNPVAAIWICGPAQSAAGSAADSCPYLDILEVATLGAMGRTWRDPCPNTIRCQSFFTDYPRAFARGPQGVLDDWATPLTAYRYGSRRPAFRIAGLVARKAR